MNAATEPPEPRDHVRLLVLDPTAGTVLPCWFGDLPNYLRAGDLVVVNDAATLPASLRGRTSVGAAIEARLMGPAEHDSWRAALFGDGDWRTPTEHRPMPPLLARGDRVDFAAGLSAEVAAVDARSPRLIELTFDRDGAALWGALYAAGAPIQYAYVAAPLPLWSVQTVYATRPWAMEMPSAGRPLTWEILGALRRRDVRVAALTHAAGLSSTGDPAIDAALPLPERYEIPAETVAAIDATHASGGRVIAVGTTVIRALEGCAAAHGRLLAGAGETALVIGPGFVPRIVDGLLSGMHDRAESHWQILCAFAPDELLERGTALADQLGFRGHELGDATLILSNTRRYTQMSPGPLATETQREARRGLS